MAVEKTMKSGRGATRANVGIGPDAGRQEADLPLGEIGYLLMGGPWIETWLNAGKLWAAWAGMLLGSAEDYRPGVEGERERRQAPAMPWIPQVESATVPLRRHSDPPGASSSRISMRMRVPAVPWMGDAGGKVIAIDAFLPRMLSFEGDAAPDSSSPAADAKPPRPRK